MVFSRWNQGAWAVSSYSVVSSSTAVNLTTSMQQLTQCFRPTGISQSRRTRAHREGSVGSLQGPAAWKTEQGGEEKKGEEETGKGKDLILG